MLIDPGGVIETFNLAGAEMFGLDRAAVVGRTFAEVFLGDEDFEEFNEVVLAAVYNDDVAHKRTADVTVDGRTLPLTVETTYLRAPAEDATGRASVVAVFADISEVESLRAKEIELLVDVKSKHMELRAAYHSLEESNRDLAVVQRKVHMVRTFAAACIVVLVAGIGAYLWDDPEQDWFGSDERPADEATSQGRAVTVKPTRLVSTVLVSSAIRPRREVAVTSPVEGKIGVVHVQSGQQVQAGDPLLELDVRELRIERRRARANLLKADRRLSKLQKWETGVEVSRARRALTKSRIALEAGSLELTEIDFLVERGLAPASKKVAAERTQRTRQLDIESAEQDLRSVLTEGRDDLELARIELDNATAEIERIDAILEVSTVFAPVAGVVLRLGTSATRRTGTLATGTSVDPGTHLVTIGDMTGITATGRVDEADVRHVQPGDTVLISGPAFPNLTLEGRITHVSSQASRTTGQQRLPSFAVAAAVNELNEAERAAVRIGMSAKMKIIVQESDDALVVPVRAVDIALGKRRVRVRDPNTGTVRSVEVTTGITTLDSVEIVTGLSAGDTVLVR